MADTVNHQIQEILTEGSTALAEGELEVVGVTVEWSFRDGKRFPHVFVEMTPIENPLPP